VQELLYWSDCYNDELPFYEDSLGHTPGKKILKVPYSLDTNDFRYHLPTGWSSSDDFYHYLKDAFDTSVPFHILLLRAEPPAVYEEGQNGKAGLMNVGLHVRGLSGS
jgi:hypothetical protein